MKNTATYILTCPHCGASKQVSYCKTSWTTANSVLWSDGHIESDEWFEPARTLQCPSCKRFFLKPKMDDMLEVKTPCDDTGHLPLQILKQAITELSGNDEDVVSTRMEAWWAYNIMYRNVADEDIPSTDREFIRSNMQWLLDYYNRTEPGFQYLTFELLRLLGYEEEYRQKLADMTYERFAEWYCERFKKRGIDHTSDVELLKRKYNSRVEEFTEALNKPLRPYAK